MADEKPLLFTLTKASKLLGQYKNNLYYWKKHDPDFPAQAGYVKSRYSANPSPVYELVQLELYIKKHLRLKEAGINQVKPKEKQGQKQEAMPAKKPPQQPITEADMAKLARLKAGLLNRNTMAA